MGAQKRQVAPVVVLASEGDPVLSSLGTAHALNCPAMTQASPQVRFGVSWLPHVAELVGIVGGVVSGVINLESSGA